MWPHAKQGNTGRNCIGRKFEPRCGQDRSLQKGMSTCPDPGVLGESEAAWEPATETGLVGESEAALAEKRMDAASTIS